MFGVVIPLYNKAPTIERALESVCAQTFPAAEIVVVNDGSTDGGEAIARGWPDPRVRVIDQPNCGVSAARNAGIVAVSQPFVAFLDADDRWRPEFLATMQALIGAHPDGVLYGAGFFTVQGAAIKRYHGIGAGPASERPAGPIDFFAERMRDFPLHTSTTVVPREKALAIGGFPEGVAHAEDLLFWAKLALTGPVVATPAPMAEYDVAVPGQFVTYWTGAYRERFDILDYHRFLADELRRRRRLNLPADSFDRFARRELRIAVFQRAWWGRFDAVAALWRELGLGKASLGPLAACIGWVSRHGAIQPPIAAVMRGLRGMRGLVSAWGT